MLYLLQKEREVTKMEKYLLVIDHPQRKEYIPFRSFWAMCLRMRDLKAHGVMCHIARG